MKKSFKLGKMEIFLSTRRKNKPRCPACGCPVPKTTERCFGCGAPARIATGGGDFIDGCAYFEYVSWCFPSETFFLGPIEINIQNRRK